MNTPLLFHPALSCLSFCLWSSVFFSSSVLILSSHFYSTSNPSLLQLKPFICSLSLFRSTSPHPCLLSLLFSLLIPSFLLSNPLFSSPSFFHCLLPHSLSLFSLFLSSDCQFEIGGWDGVIRSSQVEEEEKVKPGDALDCIWTIRAPPQSKVSAAEHMIHQARRHAILLIYFRMHHSLSSLL